MYSDGVWQLAFGAVLIWNLVLTVLFLRQKDFVNKLFPKSGERDIRVKFEEILGSVGKFDKSLKGLEKSFEAQVKDSLGHVQKVKLLRYNPYDEVGGDQSFTAVFLNKKGSGLVITSLHNRSGTRVFAKQVTEGKATEHAFSKEEAQVVKEVFEE
ncbi:MAG: DUF4446 family protein [Candidatus Daviesbacteria bacterium]|nr:DUF4446 family protein [Candidatus Daviesbacteria bacterium]